MKALLELRDVSRRFGATLVFERISFVVESGRHLGLLGPSGCGKSTLLRLIAGLDAPTSGEILIDGRRVAEAGKLLVPPHERGIAMVFQDLALWPNLSALENVALGLASLRLPRAQLRDRAVGALRACGIEPFATRHPAALSLGQQQRVAFARAIAVRPALLLLDEPFSSLDLALKAQLFDELQRLVTEFKMTLLLVTHDPLETHSIAEDVAVLEDGRLVEFGPLHERVAAPRSRTLGAYIRTLGTMDGGRSAPGH
ncbi:MAG: ABC transporter ATP-binding protein [Verrucomicrobiota bacterium]|nr:ABC transporter ATP-binding protein [Verrucomicrobiota bacterium]